MNSIYVDPLINGQDESFEGFAWRCARSLGFLFHMRNEPFDAPIPRTVTPVNQWEYHLLQSCRNELANLSTKTVDDVAQHLDYEYTCELESYGEHVVRVNAVNQKLDAMIDRVRAWQAPQQLEEFKRFMVAVLQDRREPVPTVPTPPPDAQQFITDRRDFLQGKIEYYEGLIEELEARVTEKQKQLDLLFELLGEPPQNKKANE
jgi:hypothetical protein